MEKIREILNRFNSKKAVVIGDVMLDKYIYGEVSRINPEAPVPIVSVNKEIYEIGGAGNVASNISSLGGNVCLFGFVGKDKEADILRKLLLDRRINYFFDENNITTQKTRVLGRNQQIVRFDKEETIPKFFTQETKDILFEKSEEADIISVSDYAKGAITSDLVNFLSRFKKKIIFHPKPSNKNVSMNCLKDVLLIIPNEKETLEMSGTQEISEAGNKLRKEFSTDLLVTRGEKGMTLFSDYKIEIPTYAKKIYDVQGASDTVVSAVSLAIASGASLEEAGIIANHAAGIAVERIGTYSVKLDELKNRILIGERKIVNFDELKKIVIDLKRQNKKIIWTNGCFDVLHAGHKYNFEKAKEKGDVLIVGLDSDDSVKMLKGPTRPIYKEKERIELLSSIEFIDYITVFSYGQVVEYLKELKPNVYVKSGDYTLETINQQERQIVESYGGEIYLPKGVSGLSTTSVIERIKNFQNEQSNFP